jgi:hypothetical protein
LFFTISDGFGQEFPSELLHEGELVLLNGDTLKGQIKYNLENDLIQIIINETVQTYSARKILYFSIYDKTVDMYRNFYSIPFEVQPNYKVPILFEVLYEGKLSLLAREAIVTETVPQYSYMYRSSVNMTRTKLDYEYYFLDEDGSFTKFNNKKFELYDVMKRREPQIKQYIKKNRLKIDSRRDLVRIVAYYNALLGQ